MAMTLTPEKMAGRIKTCGGTCRAILRGNARPVQLSDGNLLGSSIVYRKQPFGKPEIDACNENLAWPGIPSPHAGITAAYLT
jgi:hypothetical protein